jgi:hypothetical protein
VLHLHFAFGLTSIPSLGLPGTLSLGRNDITNSPPHARQCRWVMLYSYSNAEDSSDHN